MTKTADVVSASQIVAAWGNEIRDRTIQLYGSMAEVVSSNPTPVKGLIAYIMSGDAAEGLYVYNGVNWRPPWNQPWGVIGRATVNSGGTTGPFTSNVDVAGLSITFTAVANRLYKATSYIQAPAAQYGSGNTQPGYETFICVDGALTAGNHVSHGDYNAGGAPTLTQTIGVADCHVYHTTLSAGTHTIKVQMGPFASTINCYYTANSQYPNQLLIEDVGPMGVPT